jgi:NAD(P)-dependent dehydrogenase (short-subunit alcohol dehydrogenase family)
MFELQGRTALVTGAGQGMGMGIARALGQQGAKLWINDLFPERAEQACETLLGEGLQASPAAFDVTEYELAAATIEKLGPVDILVNNAGIPGREGMELRHFADMSPAEWQPQVDLNLYGTLNCTHAVLPGMRDRQWGRIIVISSDAGRVGTNAGTTIYGACKAAAVQLVRNLSQEVASMGITANAISLGPMNNLPEDIAGFATKGVPVKRLGTPADAGAAAVYLASEESSWVTGQLLPVNGGISPA